MHEENVEKWFKSEVLSNPTLYPELFRIETMKNRFKFQTRRNYYD
jgi:hypothetical protein